MRLISVVLSFVLCSPFYLSSAHASQMRMIVPFAAGGTADVLGRIVAQELGTLTGNQIVVENRPGSGGNIGADSVARGPADGSLLLLGTIGIHAANKIYKTLPYDPNKDLQPVTILAEVPNVLIVHPSVPAKDVKEFGAGEGEARRAQFRLGRQRFVDPHDRGIIQAEGEGGPDARPIPGKRSGAE